MTQDLGPGTVPTEVGGERVIADESLVDAARDRGHTSWYRIYVREAKRESESVSAKVDPSKTAIDQVERNRQPTTKQNPKTNSIVDAPLVLT